MSIEKRPTCVTVIGWFWIIAGGFMCLSAIMGLLVYREPGQLLERVCKIFPFLLPVQFGILGIISGVNFLKLKGWSRSVLEVLAYLSLILLIPFGVIYM